MRGSDVTMVDACTRHGRGGSRTAVLIDEAAVTDSARRAIVRRAGTSHAAFIDTGTEIAPTVRFFTHGELKNCGHGTIEAQLEDNVANLTRRGRRRVVVPHRLHQSRHGYRSSGAQEQTCQQPLMPWSADGDPSLT